jgi:hypothetical protein
MMIKLRWMSWVGHIPCKGNHKCIVYLCWKTQKDKITWGDPCEDGRVILK